MSIAKQLYQLQDIDLELESDEQTLNLIINQLGESNAIIQAEEKLESERQTLEELTRQQHSIEWEVEDITSKQKKVEEELYSGRIRNPKELADLQHESEVLKANLARLEEQALEIMEKVEQAAKSVVASDSALNRLKAEWQSQQRKLSADMEKLKKAIASLKNKRQRLVKDIDQETIDIYTELRKQRGTAVARVQQGTCLGCRITLPVSDLQRARGGSLVRCSSCGRILFLA
jgi:predicted  nucleic acid-binding Zn-ribbon protein